MQVKLEVGAGNGSVESPPSRETVADTEFGIGDLSRPLRGLLIVWVGLCTAVVLWLAIENATLTTEVWDLIGTVLLFGIGITCALALVAILRRSTSALIVTLVSQLFIITLAGYVWLVDHRSPVSQLLGVTGVALAAGAIAVLWVCHLGRHAGSAVTKGAALVAALFPLVGLAQFWMQTDYLPRSSRPLVNVQAELTPMGSSGPIVHALAKVTLHNRGTVQADMRGGVMGVVSFPRDTPAREPTRDAVAAGVNPFVGFAGVDFRLQPSGFAESRLLYAENFASLGTFLAPGGTEVYQAIVDIDTRVDRLARLSVYGVLVTQRAVEDTTTCYDPQYSYTYDSMQFQLNSRQSHEWMPGTHVLCSDTQIASTGIVHDLVSDHPVLRVLHVIDSPFLDAPVVLPFFGTRDVIADPLSHIDSLEKGEKANPSTVIWASAEYAPSDADVSGGGVSGGKP
ncbi:hypothetical protein [Mycobacterium sp. ACS4331]|uniref:hypothetical protein n=1 Tax=Mycobacterium sp. ACS4331 TaxID=1834121 RepID=UPI0007FDA81E|nr:hypothetical protein [Mycobacterium sp. ACS4331]OBF22211.1 hypothetical protein A5727_07720 [Mycobacterium sp. ACS4331]